MLYESKRPLLNKTFAHERRLDNIFEIGDHN